MPHWQTCMRIMEKLWGFSLQSSQPTSQVGENKTFKETDIIISVFLWFVQRKCKKHKKSLLLFTESTKNGYHSGFTITWQVLQTLATYHSWSLVSILSSTSAQTRSTTLRNTPKQQVRQHVSIGNRCLFLLMKLNYTAISHQLFPGHVV